MAQLINYCAAAGHKIHSTIVRLLTSDQCCQAKPVPSGQPRQSLSSMPTEILLQITDFLPPSSAACLVLCSRHILTALGNQSLSSLRADDQIIERRRFLIALQNDLPDWLLCYPCSLFHPMKAHERPDQIWRHHKEALFVQENGAVYLTTDYGIRYQHVQLFMKEYRIERSYTKILDTLSFSFSWDLGDSVLEGTVWGDIVAGELVLRFDQRLRLLVPSNIELIRKRLRPVCLHFYWLGGDQTLWEAIDCGLSHAGDSLCAECSMRKPCPECSTLFQVGVQEPKKDSETEIQVKAWKYLGTCETPYDPEWRKQAKPQPQRKDTVFKPVTAAQWASLHCIRSVRKQHNQWYQSYHPYREACVWTLYFGRKRINVNKQMHLPFLI